MTMTAPEVELETWVVVYRSKWALWRIDSAGHEQTLQVRHEQKFTITPQERRHNENKVLKATDNPFRNGCFKLLKAVEGDEDTPALVTNANAITDEEISELFNVHHMTFPKELAKIDATGTLRRILDWGDATGAATKRLDQVRARLVELDPQAFEARRAADPLDPNVRPKVDGVGDGEPQPDAADYYALEPDTSLGVPSGA